MPNTVSGRAIASQIVRSGTSPAANYRAACIGKSEKDFLNKLKMVEEELDETCHWIEIIMDAGMLPQNRLEPLYNECKELLKITVSSINCQFNCFYSKTPLSRVINCKIVKLSNCQM